jgi:NAD(P)-dependent dehydrogenase (short-subunit alcohol dehydrogenase family)
MKLKDKVSIITGAGGGLGFVFCKRFLEEGSIVILSDVSEDYLNNSISKLREFKDRIQVKILDVTNKSQVNQIMKEIYDEFGSIDILVNNAGGGLNAPKELDKIKEEHWDLVVDVNLKGAFLCSQAAIKYMKKKNSGRIINVSSIGGRTASIVSNVAYAAAKGGINSMTRRLALEVGSWGINVNAIAPGTVLSGQRMINVWNELDDQQKQSILNAIPLRRLSTAEEQADVILFLAEEASRYITGAIIDVNGGRFMAG